MARYSDEQVEKVKQGISLLRLVEAKGIVLKQHGKDYIGHCPFHDDKTPSFVVSPHNNLWNCLGACGVGGSVVDWVMKIEGVSFRHAMELLLAGEAVSAPLTEGKLTKQATIPKLPCPVSENANDQTVIREVLDYYHQTLKQSPEAIAYLEKRGLNDPQLVDHFQLGYANRSLGLRLPFGNRATGKAIRDQLQRIGLYRDTGREHFNGSLVIPVISKDGNITEIYGRKLLNNLTPGIPKHCYLPGPHKGVFNEIGLQNTEEVILCEALIDAMSFWRWGFKHVTASYGVNGFTDDILQALIDNKIKRVLIAYDRDEAGNGAAAKLAAALNQHGMDVFRIVFPKGMDANEYALKVQPAQKSLALVIRKAEWVSGAKNKTAPEITTTPFLVADVMEAMPEQVAPVASVTNHVMDELKNISALLADDEEEPEQHIQQSQPKKPEPPLKIKQEEQRVDVSATPMPSPTSELEATITEHDIHIELGDRKYRIRGMDKNSSMEQLKINLRISRNENVHVDKLDLYSHKQRQVFVNQASVELGLAEDVIKKDLGKLLLKLEALQETNKHNTDQQKTKEIMLSDEQHREALSLLRDKNLLDRILNDFALAGVVGEESNKLTGYLACVSRKLDKPLAVLIQSSSAAGKSSLMDAILALMPEEERVQYSAMTGQSLFYMGETNLKNKILAIAEEEGAHNASYALKLLQSEGVVTIASTGKDEATGNLITKEYKVQGPVMLFLTTTAIDIDEELLNRCLVLSVNESREQTQAIHRAQRQKRTLQGLQDKLEREAIIALHQNAQRLIRPLHIINPYADQLTFLDDKTRTRRDHEKYLTLIDSIALLHQHQREVKTLTTKRADVLSPDTSAYRPSLDIIHYIEVTLQDIEQANRIAHEVLGRTLDELPPQTRKLLKEIKRLVEAECKQQQVEQCHFRFSRKVLRDKIGWTCNQMRVHLDRLVQMEYVLVHRGGRGQSFDYELLYDGGDREDGKHMMGLMDVSTMASVWGNKDKLVGSLCPQNGASVESEKTLQLNDSNALHETTTQTEKGTSGVVQQNASYINSRNSKPSHIAGVVHPATPAYITSL